MRAKTKRRRELDARHEAQAIKRSRSAREGRRAASPKRDLTVRSFAVKPDSIDEKTRSVEAVLATDAPVTVFDLERWEPIEEVLVLGGGRWGEQVPLLDSHDRTSIERIIGSVRQIRIEDARLVGRLFFSSADEGQQAWLRVKEGHLTDLSVGYRIDEAVMIERGKSLEVSGQTYTASSMSPLRITPRWTLRETSACAIGADAAAKMRGEETPSPRREGDHDMDFAKWLKARGIADPAKLAEGERTLLDGIWKAEVAAEATRAAAAGKVSAGTRADDAPSLLTCTLCGSMVSSRATSCPACGHPMESPVAAEPTEPGRSAQRSQPRQSAGDLARAVQEAIRAERQRAIDIRAAAQGVGVPPEMVQRAIDEGHTVDQARGAFLEHLRTSRPAIHASGSGGGAEVTTRALEDGIMLRGGMEEAVVNGRDGRPTPEGTRAAEIANRFRDMSLVDVARHALVLSGRDVPIGREDMIRAAFTTSSLPVLLSNVVHKTMLRGYVAISQSWRSFCNVGIATDFKAMYRVRISSSGSWETVDTAGEIPQGKIDEESETYAVTTKGRMMTFTRQQIINDDLNALTKEPMRMGVGAAYSICDAVYTHLMSNPTMGDGVACFIAAHNNLNASCALSSTNLPTAITAFRNQTDIQGQPVLVEPAWLIVPPALEEAAKILMKSDRVINWGGTAATKVGDVNPWQGLMTPMVEPRLSNSKFTGYSTSTWYISASPNIHDTLEVGFLQGKQEPTIEVVQLPAAVLGFGWRGYIDFGCKILDWRSLQKNTA
jgi:hypothetical protein